MKQNTILRGILFTVVIVMSAISALAQTSGWEDKGAFKQIKAHNVPIFSASFIDSGRKIITTSGSEYKIWDTETGELVKERNIDSNDIFNTQISQSKKEIFVVYYNKPQNPYIRKIEAFDIESDSLIFTYNYNHTQYVCSYLKKFDLKKVNVLYNRDSTTLYYSSVFDLECDNSSLYGGTFGLFLKVQYKNDILLNQEYSYAPFSLNQTPAELYGLPNRNLLCVYDIFGFQYDYHGSTNTKGYLTGLIEISENFSESKQFCYDENINDSNPAYDPCQSLRYLPNKQIAATLKKSNKMQFWSLSDYKLKTEGKLPFTPIDYHFSLSENRIIAGARNGFYIYSTPSMTAIDSIPFPEADYGWKIAVSPDSVSFAAGNSDGYLVLMKSNRLIGPDEPISVPETEKTNEYEVSPNPASDYINLPKGMPTGKEVSIFSIIGYKAYTGAPNGDRINIGFLPPGIYFLEFGNSRYKFLKI